MVFETLKRVKSTERESLAKLENAKVEAEKIVSEATKEAAELVNKAKSEANAEVVALIEAAVSKAKGSADQILSSGEHEARQFEGLSTSKVSSAKDFIVSQIIG